MKKEKIKHIALVIVAVCLIGIGYMNYDSTIEVASMDNSVDEATLRRCTVSKCKYIKGRYCSK